VPEPDVQVKKLEDQIEQAVLKAKRSGPQSRFPLRPGFGTQGKEVLLYANYFELSTEKKQILFRYNTEILQEASGRNLSARKAKQIIQLFLDQHLLQYQNSVASDYRSTLVSKIELPLQSGASYDVKYKAPEDDEFRENPQIYHVRLQFTGNLMVSELLDYLSSTNASAMFNSKEEVLQALNIVVGHHPKKDPHIASVGANKHFSLNPAPQDRFSLGAGLEAMRGFFVSVRAATARLLVNVQVKNIACYEEGELKSVIAAYRAPSTYKLEVFLKNVRVRVTHLRSKNPRIKSVCALAAPQDGRNLPHPPKVPRHGAGPRQVEFWLDAQGPGQGSSEQSSSKGEGKGKKGKKAAKAGPEQAGKYISIAEYFRQSKSTLDPYCQTSMKMKMN
jgi:eukaryotic translation initiation factor 2C